MSADGDIAALTYEQALAELDTLIQRLEGGAVNLDEAIACYERASRLAQHCAELLDRTEQKITQLVVGPSGPQERPFSPEVVPTAPSGAPSAASAAAERPVPIPTVDRAERPAMPPPPMVPPPPSAPVRARPVRPAPEPASVPPLPGFEPASRQSPGDVDIDPDDIPF